MLVLVCRCGWWVCLCGEIVEPFLYSPRVVPVCGKAVAWAPHGGAGCAGFVSCEPACVSDVLAPCGSVGAPQPGGVLGLAGGGVGSAGDLAAHGAGGSGSDRGQGGGGHAYADLEGQAERAPPRTSRMMTLVRTVSELVVLARLVVGRGCLTAVPRVSAWVVGCSPLVEDGGVGVGGAEGEDGSGLPGVFRTLLVFLLQAAFVKFRSSRSTSLGARYPRAE